MDDGTEMRAVYFCTDSTEIQISFKACMATTEIRHTLTYIA